jgi:hypothetical protein
MNKLSPFSPQEPTMKSIYGIVSFASFAAAILLVPLLFAAEPSSPEQAKLEQEFEKRSQEMIAGILKEDLTAWEASVADDNMLITAEGTLLDKNATRQILKSAKLESWVVDDVKRRVVGQCVVVTGRSTIKGYVNGKTENNAQFRVTEVVANRDGKWQSVATQFTRIAPASSP